jgi:methylthioribulose-1-phosphate dehydratase
MLTAAPAVEHSPAFAAISAELVETVWFLSAKGWTPATSSNFSARIPGYDGMIAISRSGVDKARFAGDDVMIVDRAGHNVWPEQAKSSAETLIHTAIYDLFDPGAVLHTHSVNATAFSLVQGKQRSVTFSGLELLKGLSGITTHEASVEVPIFPNDQDMVRFSGMLRQALPGKAAYGFLISGHGLYTWGQTLAEARRHLEVFEFLFELAFRMEGNHGSAHDSG